MIGGRPGPDAAMYHKDLVRAVFPRAVARPAEQGRFGAVYLYAGPLGDDQPIGGGFDEDEAWITAALAVAMDEGAVALLGMLRGRGEGPDRLGSGGPPPPVGAIGLGAEGRP